MLTATCFLRRARTFRTGHPGVVVPEHAAADLPLEQGSVSMASTVWWGASEASKIREIVTIRYVTGSW